MVFGDHKLVALAAHGGGGDHESAARCPRHGGTVVRQPPHRATPAVRGEAPNTGEPQPGSEEASPEAGAATATSGDRRERST